MINDRSSLRNLHVAAHVSSAIVLACFLSANDTGDARFTAHHSDLNGLQPYAPQREQTIVSTTAQSDDYEALELDPESLEAAASVARRCPDVKKNDTEKILAYAIPLTTNITTLLESNQADLALENQEEALAIVDWAFGTSSSISFKIRDDIIETNIRVGRVRRALALNEVSLNHLERGTPVKDASWLKRKLQSVHFRITLGDFERANVDLVLTQEWNRSRLYSHRLDDAELKFALGKMYATLGRYKEAESILQECVELLTNELGATDPFTASIALQLGDLYLKQNEYEKALTIIRSSTEHIRAASGIPQLMDARILWTKAEYYRLIGDYEFSEGLLRNCLDIRSRSESSTSLEVAETLERLGAVLIEMDDVDEAKQVLQRCLTIYTDSLGGNHLRTASVLDLLGNIAIAEGRFDEAVRLINLAYSVREKARHPDLSISYESLARLLAHSGKFGEANRFAEKSIALQEALLGKENAGYLSELLLYTIQAKITGPLIASERILELQERILKRLGNSPKPFLYGNIGLMLSILLRDMGEYDASISVIHSALQEFDITTGGTQMASLKAFEEKGLHDKLIFQLLSLLRESTRHATPLSSPMSSLYPHILEWKGQRFSARQKENYVQLQKNVAGDPYKYREACRKLAAEALSLYRDRNRNSEDQFLKRLPNLMQRRADTSYLLDIMASGQMGMPRFDFLFRPSFDFYSYLPLHSALVDLIEYREQAVFGADLTTYIAAIVSEPDGQTRFIDLGPAQEIYSYSSLWIHSLHDRYEAPEDLASGKSLRSRLWDPLEPHLSGASLIFWSPDSLLNDIPVHALPSRNAGRRLIEEHNFVLMHEPLLIPDLVRAQSVANPRLPSLPQLDRTGKGRFALANRDPLRSLYPELGDGARGEIGDVFQRQIDQVMGFRHPFADMRQSFDFTIVADIDYGPIEGRDHSPASVLGREAAQDRDREGFFPLPGTTEELGAIERILRTSCPGGTVTTLRGSTATEETVRSRMEMTNWIHFATHGYFFSTPRSTLLAAVHPELLSGLALAGVNAHPDARTHDDGLLSALEISSLDLSSADLVFLSACSSARGYAVPGEGLLSLQRAFQLAGARSVVGALWPIDDALTVKFVSRFYSNFFSRSMGKADAFREAQLWMLAESRRLRKDGSDDPRSWASFALSGDWR